MEMFPLHEFPEPLEIPGQLTFFPEQPAASAHSHNIKRTYPELSPLSLNDPHLVNILICSILFRFDGRLPEPWLYEIIVSSGHISYFLYADAIGFLLESGAVVEEQECGQQIAYYLTERGQLIVKKLRQYVPKPLRDQVMLTALRYVSRQKALKELSLTYESDDEGCAVCMRCMDGGNEMFTLRIHAPSEESARMLGERILRNPAGFFGKIIDIAMNNEEECFDLSDN